jgi:hypothetical protein
MLQEEEYRPIYKIKGESEPRSSRDSDLKDIKDLSEVDKSFLTEFRIADEEA